MLRKLVEVLLVLVMFGSLVSPALASNTSNRNSSIKPLQYYPGCVITFVYKSNGEKVGSKEHYFYGVSSGTDHYYDPSTWGKYRGGAILGCVGYCACSTSGSCTVKALSSTSKSVNTSNKVEPCDWYGYDTCDYSSYCSNGCGAIYGTVTASCSTIYGCYISVEWHAMCYDRGL